MSVRYKGKKIGRNAPCPCGSGQKFKRCHGLLTQSTPIADQQRSIPPHVRREAERQLQYRRAAEQQRQAQQGHGRAIVSIEHEGTRFIAVGPTMYWSTKWRTFHDFLFWYIKKVLGSDGWGNRELKKPFAQRHPIIQWYDHLCRYQREFIKEEGKVHSAPAIGAVRAYLGLAYYLYLLGHNNKDISTRLIRRLKDPLQFRGAFYETYVASVFIQAGFELEFENEDDRSSTHCEFTATAPGTGRKFSVEAKARQRAANKGSTATGTPTLRVGRQLFRALEKVARYPRVIFIDANVPDANRGKDLGAWMHSSLHAIRRLEGLRVKGLPAEAAYVFVTNHPYTYDLLGTDYRAGAVVEGFKISEFKGDATFMNIRAADDARKRHQELYLLMESMKSHHEIPSTFDGDNPALAFSDDAVPRLVVGQKYLVPDADGNDVPGELEDAVVLEESQDSAKVHGVFRLDTGKRIHVSCPLTPSELRAYKTHPDTFFGVVKRVPRKLEKLMDFYDFFYESNKQVPKEQLLNRMKNWPNAVELANLPQDELARMLSEAHAQHAFSQMGQTKASKAEKDKSDKGR